jgi:secreted trypsin-like serine protease
MSFRVSEFHENSNFTNFCVFSAAHCFENKGRREEDVKSAKDIVAWVGKHNLDRKNETGSVAHYVGELIIHEDWEHNGYDFDADIALLLLKTEVDLTQEQFVWIVCLPTPSQGEVTGNGTVVGFGVSERSEADGEKHDSTPNELTLPAVTQDECSKNHNLHGMSSNRTFCAGFENQGKSACKGDSGGGFYQYDYGSKSYILAGIVSSSPRDRSGGCNINDYSVFTDVSKFVGWIQEKMKIEWTYVKLSVDKR